MMDKLIPAPYRILALMLLIGACIGFGYTQGITRESDRRDALELAQKQADEKAFSRLLASGQQHARNAIEWRNEARSYYQKWKGLLDEKDDTQLAECQTQAGVSAVRLSAAWLGLYNSAWMPEFGDPGDTGGAAYALVETGAVTPREVLSNVRVNAELCGDDRKRLDELIDLLVEIKQQTAD